MTPINIKRRKVDNRIELQIATGCIVSTEFLKGFRLLHQPKLLAIPYVQRICDWCLDFYEEFQRAPGTAIQTLYEEKLAIVGPTGIPEDEADLIGDFLSQLSTEFERADKFNAGYLLDKAQKRLIALKLTQLNSEIAALVEDGHVEEAQNLISTYSRIQKNPTPGVDPLTDPDLIFRAFNAASEPLFRLPGPAGELLNEFLIRGGFLGVLAPEKRGKSFTLQELAIFALMDRCNVAVFDCGDMSEEQQAERLAVRLSHKSNIPKYCGHIEVPCLDCQKNQDGSCRLPFRTGKGKVRDPDDKEFNALTTYKKLSEKDRQGYVPCTECRKEKSSEYRGAVWYRPRFIPEPLTWDEALVRNRKFVKFTAGKKLRLSCHPSNSLTTDMIDNILDVWEEEDGFVADLIIVDYADILAPSNPKLEFRHQENEKWKGLRFISQKRRALLVAATQADDAGKAVYWLTQDNWSEDKRKWGHVTAGMGINQTPEEKKQGLARWNIFIARRGDFNPGHGPKILQSLKTGQPLIGSYW